MNPQVRRCILKVMPGFFHERVQVVEGQQGENRDSQSARGCDERFGNAPGNGLGRFDLPEVRRNESFP